MPEIPRRCAKGGGCRYFQPCPKHGTSNWKNSKSPPMPDNPKKLKKQVAARDGWRCRRCGRESKRLDLDHRIPRSAGGGDELSNLQLLCPLPCHRDKGLEDRKKYSKGR